MSIIRSRDYLKKAVPKLGVVEKKCNPPQRDFYFSLHYNFREIQDRIAFCWKSKKYEKGSIVYSFRPHTSDGCNLSQEVTRRHRSALIDPETKKVWIHWARSPAPKLWDPTGEILNTRDFSFIFFCYFWKIHLKWVFCFNVNQANVNTSGAV